MKRPYKKRIGKPRGPYKKTLLKISLVNASPMVRHAGTPMVERIGKPRGPYKKRIGKPRGPYKKTLLKNPLFKRNDQKLLTAGTIKLAITVGRLKYRAPSNLWTSILYTRLSQKRDKNSKDFLKKFFHALKTNKYEESIDELDDLSHDLRRENTKTELTSGPFRILNKIIITDGDIAMDHNFNFLFLHMHLKFILKNRNSNTHGYVLYGHVVFSDTITLATKPLFFGNNENISALGYTMYKKILEKMEEYGTPGVFTLNYCKIITGERLPKALLSA